MGELYSVMFSKCLEIYRVDSDTPLHRVDFDSIQTGFDYLSKSAIIVCDDKGRLTLLTQIESPETIQMKIIETDCTRFRTVAAH